MATTIALESHAHARLVLDHLEQYNDFMESISTVCDMGAGEGLDAEWWATREVEDESGRHIPLDIKVTALDIQDQLNVEHQHIKSVTANFEDSRLEEGQFDVIWCHDSFQYALDPINTLKHWWHLTRDNGMLCLQVQQTTNIKHNQQTFYQHSGVYHHHTVVNLIHMLALNGWDCRDAHFWKKMNDPWIKCVVYKTKHRPRDARHTTWYELAETELLPESAVSSINKWGFLRQQDLQLSWLDGSLEAFFTH